MLLTGDRTERAVSAEVDGGRLLPIGMTPIKLSLPAVSALSVNGWQHS